MSRHDHAGVIGAGRPPTFQSKPTSGADLARLRMLLDLLNHWAGEEGGCLDAPDSVHHKGGKFVGIRPDAMPSDLRVREEADPGWEERQRVTDFDIRVHGECRGDQLQLRNCFVL